MNQPMDNMLPVGFRFGRTGVSVEWVDFGDSTLHEPFFAQSIRAIRSKGRGMIQTDSSISDLFEKSARVPCLEPTVVIFHISRCGSTFLTNLLRSGQDCCALSEASPIGSLWRRNLFNDVPFVQPEDEGNIRKRLLDSVVSLYGAKFGRNVIIKCHAASTLKIPLVRSIWPTVPFILVIRNPIEVIVSNLDKPGWWLRSMSRQIDGANIFGLGPTELRQMSMEQYCAFGIGQFLKSAGTNMDPNMWVVDYSQLSLSNIQSMASRLGIALPDDKAPDFRGLLLQYSKDITGTRAFQEDSDWKIRDAPESVRKLASELAIPHYEKLRQTAGFATSIC